MIKKIIHVDMDYFYAAIEIRDNPSIKDKPVAIGGKPEQRGVLSTCNYIARRYGLHSAMSTYSALKKCPDLVLLPVNMPLYKSVSQQIHSILNDYTDIIEPISLDEAYLDVTNVDKHFNSATLIAQEIKDRIYQDLNLTASAGISSLKFLAKIASDYNKPNGIFTIPPQKIEDFLLNLSLKKLPGVGDVTYKKLEELNLYTCADIRKLELSNIINIFGKFGERIWQFSHGIDNREIVANRIRKSVGVEITLLQDINSLDEARNILSKLYDTLLIRLKNQIQLNTHLEIKHGVKLKFNDFKQTTIERKMFTLNKNNFTKLLEEIWQRKENRSVRLIGIQIQLPKQNISQQLSLF